MTEARAHRRVPRIRGAAPLSAADLAVDEWAVQAIGERLPRIRAVATSWGASVSAITALLGTGTVIDADDQVRALTSGWDVAYGVLVAGALLAAAASIYFASCAAQFRVRDIPPDVEGRARELNSAFESAVADLTTSRRCAALAVVLLIASMGVRWYGPTG